MEKTTKHTISIGGGKGGIGKSFISVNLGAELANNDRRVILIDLDLGCANLHSFLLTELPQVSICDFLNGRKNSISETLIKTGIPNLSLISGYQDALDISNLKYYQKLKLLKAINQLEADYIVLDLGPGTSFNMLDFFLFADFQIVVAMPEQTSVENTYRFFQSCLLRRLKAKIQDKKLFQMVQVAMDPKNREGLRKSVDLYRWLKKFDPGLAEKVKAEIINWEIHLVVNGLKKESDKEIGKAIQRIGSVYFGAHIAHLGNIEYDEHVWQSIRTSRPLVQEYSHTKSAASLRKIARLILNHLEPH